MFLTVDGGGSKINAILYDENMNVLRRARSGGVNFVQNTPESCRRHIHECLTEVLAGVSHLESAEAVIAGDKADFEAELKNLVTLDNFEFISEPTAGLMAAACKDTGYLALSGTGSDVFYMEGGRMRAAVGGWGPVLGDQGSGVWMGIRAIRAVSKACNGWGEKTLLKDMLDEWFLENFGKKMYEIMVNTLEPYSVAARIVPVIGKAAAMGDHVSLEIFTNAGIALGKQMEVVMNRVRDENDMNVYLCGGAWKACEVQKDACEDYLRTHVDDGIRLIRPMFEHVAAGPVHRMIKQGVPREEIRDRLLGKFDKETINREAF